MSDTTYSSQDALTKLRQRLLDLSNKNLFLNHKNPYESKHCACFVNFDAYPIIAELLKGVSIELTSIPSPIPSPLGPSHTKESWLLDQFKAYSLESSTEYAADKKLLGFEFDVDLEKKLLKLQKKAKQAVEETGANSLYLSYGFLEYFSEKDPSVKLLAPLINIPVEVYQKDALSPYTITYTGAPLLENFAIKERLKQELGLTLEDFPDFLELDDWDCSGYFNAIESTLSAKSWKIKKYLSLNNLPPLNMILFHDLREENWIKEGKNLLEIPSISEILDKDVHDQESSQVYSYDIDAIDTSLPEYPLLIEEADSSQLNAVLNILNSSENQVIIGPPGTGKSQTITNIIASLMNRGKKVLFISEKLAALDVVKQRLTRAGLAPFVMPLHNNKIAKKEIVQSLSEAMDTVEQEVSTMDTTGYELVRQSLARYCYDLNSDSNNKSISAFSSIWNTNYLKLLKQTGYHFTPNTIEQFFQNKEVIADLMQEIASALNDLKEVTPSHSLWRVSSAKNELFDFSGFYSEFYSLVQTVKEYQVLISTYSFPAEESVSHFQKTLKTTLNRLEVPSADSATSVQQYLENNDANNKLELEEYAALHRKLNKIQTDISETIIDKSESVSYLGSSDLLDLTDKLIVATPASKNKYISKGIKASEVEALLDLGYGDLGSINWNNVASRELELNLFIKEVPFEFFYLLDALTLKQNQHTIQKIIEIKQIILSLQEQSELIFPTDQDSLDEILNATTCLLELSDSNFKYLNKKWYSSLTVHKKYQKNILQKFSLKEKEINLLGLLNIYNQYLSLSQEIQKLKNCPTLVEEDVFFDLDNLTREFEYSLKWDELSRTLLSKPINGQIEKLKNFAEKGLKLFLMYSDMGLHKALESEAEYLKTQPILKELFNKYVELNCSEELNFAEFVNLSYLLKTKQDILASIACEKFEKIKLNSTNYQSRLGVTKFFETLTTVPVGGWLQELCLSSEIQDNLQTLKTVAEEAVEKINKTCLNTSLTLKEIEDRFGVKIKLESFPEKANTTDLSAIVDIFENINLIPKWIQYLNSLKKLQSSLPEFVNKMNDMAVNSDSIENLYDSLKNQAYFDFSENIITTNPILINSIGAQSIKQSQYSSTDTNIIRNNRIYLKNNLIQRRSLIKGESGARVKDYTEMVLLKHLKKTPGARVTIRELFSKAGRSIQELKPCFLMGPQAVAQYLSPSEFNFDVLIIDEGSQMRLEHALGAIARSKQIIVVGDPEQLGPSSSFYGLHKEEDKWAILEAESVLTWAASKYKESSLKWHYRSKHQSLIDFSNKTFYSNSLIVVPSAELKSEQLGLNYHYLEHSNYANSINMAEVEMIVDKAVSFMKTNPGSSMGIVALNLYQAEVIEKEIEKLKASNPIVEKYIKDWDEKNESFFVKNLENVQGDERDIILVSLTFGKNSLTGVLGQNFGLISRDDGGRRLNVLVTRAKKAMHVFSSMKSMEIKEEPKTPRGTVILKRFLEYCESSGKNGIPDTEQAPESPFEKTICSLLDKRGYKYTCQLGVSGYRIDIAVKNPYQNSYLVAIECDGASYHSAKSVKDRDKLRQSVLEERGWFGKIYRIWSTDWFKDPKREAEKLMDFIEKAEIDFAS